MQLLCALAHYDFNLPGAYSYERALLVIRQFGLPMHAIEQQFRRMVFNIVARNQRPQNRMWCYYSSNLICTGMLVP